MSIPASEVEVLRIPVDVPVLGIVIIVSVRVVTSIIKSLFEKLDQKVILRTVSDASEPPEPLLSGLR